MEIVGAEPPTAETIRERHERLLARLRETAAANGHDPERLRIVAVTKTWPIEVARAALDAGLTRLGESRIQEAEPKIAAVPQAEWHFIGRLQSNKARRAVRVFPVIHSVDSFELLRSRSRARRGGGDRRRRSCSRSTSAARRRRAGSRDASLRAGARALPATGLIGLMTIAPMGASVEEARAAFARLRELRDRLEQLAGIGLPELSMGMSADAEAAAAEGATLVRIGTALFGPRG